MNYRVSETIGTDLAIVDGYTMIDFANNRQPFIPTASGLKIDGLINSRLQRRRFTIT